MAIDSVDAMVILVYLLGILGNAGKAYEAGFAVLYTSIARRGLRRSYRRPAQPRPECSV